MIKLIAIGHLGKDAIVNNVNNKNVINFSVAHTEKFKDKDGNQREKTIWIECAKWGENTGVAPYLKKGTQVYVEGNADIKTYTKQDGTTSANITLQVASIQLLGGNTQQQQAAPAATPQVQQPVADLDDLPF